ncbi:MAG: riboflavin synthase [Rubrivivax sp.]
MFTGIVQGVATVAERHARPGLVSYTLQFPAGLTEGLEVGASVAVDGTCLTVTAVQGDTARFDVMAQTLALTTLGALHEGSRVNVERSAKTGVEIGGHVLSGHVDAQARIVSIRRPENNHVIRLAVPAPWMKYLFAKGFVALNGASLTIADCGREKDGSGWIEVWLIPETLRLTTFGEKAEGDAVHLEIDRQTQVIVETVERVLAERLGA